MIEMNNKIAMVNKELHNRLFDEEEWPEESEEIRPKMHRRHHQLPPQLMLKNMIRKGLTNTQSLAQSRPKTAFGDFKRTGDDKNPFKQLRSTTTANLEKRTVSTNRRYQEPAQNNVEFEFSNGHPKEFDEFQHILNRMKYERQQEASRKKIKLERYGEKKFRYAWKKCNIPT